jgi:serine/threonine protein kinase
MAADQLETREPPDNKGGKADPMTGAAARSPDRKETAPRMVASSSGSWVRPPLSSELPPPEVSDLSAEGTAMEAGPQLEPLPEVQTSESVRTELVKVAERAWTGPGAAADPAAPERPFGQPIEGPSEVVGPTPPGPDPASGSVLGQIGQIVEPPPNLPLSVAHEEKVPISLPKQFGRYRILEQLGKGAMGSIYLAHDTQLGRRVALKVPHLRVGDDGATPDRVDLDRFYREARAAATLEHPNLCPVYDVGQIDGIPYLTMAYIKGRPLSKYIRRDRPMSQRRVAIMVRKLAQALEEAHYNGVVHRDLKPSNIMVNARGELIIMDFGLVWRIGAQNQRLTRVGLVVGTPMYMSPEQVSGKVDTIGPGCDIYSLGVIMYELLTGRVPFEGQEAFVLGQILFVEPPPPSTYRTDLDPRLESICLKAIAKSLDKRYATMGELAMAVGDYLRSAEGAPRLLDVPAPDVVEQGSVEVDEASASEPSTVATATAEAEPVGPELPIEVPESGTLWKAWRQWTAIVEHFAVRRSPWNVNRNTYINLHEILVAACRARAAKAHGPRQEFYLRLLELVVPWMTPTALESTDREILISVLSYCRQFEQELLDPTELPVEPDEVPRTWSPWWLAIGIFVASFALALAVSYWAS